MCIVFTCGEQTFRREVEGYEGLICRCYNCGNYSGHVMKTHPWFTFCFVPVIPLSIHGYEDIRCHICNFAQPLESRPDVQAMRHGNTGGAAAPVAPGVGGQPGVPLQPPPGVAQQPNAPGNMRFLVQRDAPAVFFSPNHESLPIMLYDLSIGWTPSTPPAELAHTLAMSAELGYDVVALDHVYNGPVPATIDNPLPTELPAAATGGRKRRLPRLLRRATVVVSDMTVNHRLASVAAAYDLVAVRPTTEKAFQAACLNMAEPSLISLDLTTYFPFFFKHRTAMAAVRRGVLFEVCYAQALRAAVSDSNAAAAAAANRARALFVANLVGLVRATRGRGIVVSSGAADAMELRGPADVVNLLAVWGLAPDRGTEALSGLARSVVANEGLRRRGFRGVVDIVQTADDGQSGEQQQKEKGKQKDKQKQKQKQGQSNGAAGNKRKADGNSGAGEAEAVTEAAAQTKAKQGERQNKKQKRGTARQQEGQK